MHLFRAVCKTNNFTARAYFSCFPTSCLKLHPHCFLVNCFLCSFTFSIAGTEAGSQFQCNARDSEYWKENMNLFSVIATRKTLDSSCCLFCDSYVRKLPLRNRVHHLTSKGDSVMFYCQGILETRDLRDESSFDHASLWLGFFQIFPEWLLLLDGLKSGFSCWPFSDSLVNWHFRKSVSDKIL